MTTTGVCQLSLICHISMFSGFPVSEMRQSFEPWRNEDSAAVIFKLCQSTVK